MNPQSQPVGVAWRQPAAWPGQRERQANPARAARDAADDHEARGAVPASPGTSARAIS